MNIYIKFNFNSEIRKFYITKFISYLIFKSDTRKTSNINFN